MKNIATLIVVILTSSFGFAQNGPKIEFKAKDNTIDYGVISKKMILVFVLSNLKILAMPP